MSRYLTCPHAGNIDSWALQIQPLSLRRGPRYSCFQKAKKFLYNIFNLQASTKGRAQRDWRPQSFSAAQSTNGSCCPVLSRAVQICWEIRSCSQPCQMRKLRLEARTKPSSSPSGVMAKTSSSPWKIRTRASWKCSVHKTSQNNEQSMSELQSNME